MSVRRHRFAIPALYIAAVVALGDMYLTQPILLRLSHEFGIAPATAGLSVSAVVLLIALASTFIGPLSDRLGRKSVMVWSLALLAAPTLLCALAPSFEALLVFRALQGLCIPGLTAVAVAHIADLVDADALGGAVGGWIAATVAGGLVGRVTSGVITDWLGWRAVFVLYAALTALSATLLAMMIPRGASQPTTGLAAAYRGMLDHLKDRQLVGAYLIGGALFFGFIGIFTYLPYYLTAPPFGLPQTIVAFAYLSYVAGIVTSPLSGRLSVRIPRRRLITVGLLITMVGMLLTLIPALPVIVVSLFVVCSGMFTAQAIAPAYVSAAARQAKGSASALYLMAYYFGGTLGGSVPGLAWQRLGWPGVITLCVGALLVALMANAWLCRDEPA